jgi:hypothetical protein
MGHAHGCYCFGCRYYAANNRRLLCHQAANRFYATAIFWASNVARIRFNLSRRRGLDQLHALANHPNSSRSDFLSCRKGRVSSVGSNNIIYTSQSVE